MPRVGSISRLSLIALLLAAFSSVAWAKPKVAVLGLEVDAPSAGAVDQRDAANASKLTEELRRNPGPKYDLAPNGNRELQDEKVMGNCDSEKPACMAPIGGGMGADFLVYGRIVKGTDKGKDGYKGVIKILNVKEKRVEETWEGFIPLSQIASGSLRDWSQKVNARLAGEKPPLVPDQVDRGPGKLAVTIGNTKSGQVSIDGAVKGQLQDGKFTTSLSEGAHRLEIEAQDRKTYSDTVIIASGQTATVNVDMEEMIGAPPPPPPPPPGGGGSRTAFKAAGWGLGAVAVAAGGYVLLLTVSGDIPDYEGGKFGQPLDKTGKRVLLTSSDCGNDDLRKIIDDEKHANEAFDRACSANSRRKLFGAVGIASGVLAAGALYFAYIRGGGESKERQAGIGHRTRRQLVVTPVISPNGGGATVRFDW